MKEYFTDFNLKKNKYYFKLFDLDQDNVSKEGSENEKDCISESQNVIYLWNGGEYIPDFNINICVNDQIKLSRSVLKNFKDGFSRIVSSSWALVMTSQRFFNLGIKICLLNIKIFINLTKKIDGWNKGTTSIISESVSKSFKIPDNESFARNQNHLKKIKLLGICSWEQANLSPVVFII